MKDASSVYLDVTEYEKIRLSPNTPESWCIAVEGYWVQIVPAIVYELEYRGLLTPDEMMSTYIIWDLTAEFASDKLRT